MPCMSAVMAPEVAARTSARSLGLIRGQGPSSKAVRAAATAASTSAAVPSGTVPTSSWVEGLMTSIVPVPAGATHSPPMNRLSWTMGSGMAQCSWSGVQVTLGPHLTLRQKRR